MTSCAVLVGAVPTARPHPFVPVDQMTGYQHIFANVLPLMRRRGFSEAEIEQIMVGNPARLLAFV